MSAQPPLDRLPPHSLPAEQGVLGCVLLNPSESMDECAGLNSSAFFDLRHRDLFQHLRAMHEARQPLDLITAQQRLQDAGQLEAVGGVAYLSSLMDSVPSAANLPYYLGIVREKHTLRRLIQAASETIARVHEGSDSVDSLVESFERSALAVRGADQVADSTNIRECLGEIIDEMQAAAAGKAPPRLLTGFRVLDDASLGLRPGELFIIGARPSVGKSALAMNIVEHVMLEEKRPVGVFTLEMSSKELLTRMASSLARVDSRRASKGELNNSESARLVSAIARLSKAPLHICENPGSTLSQIAAKSRRWKQRHGIQLIVVDYLGLIQESGRQRSRYETVSDVTRGMKCLAKELGIPVILLCQLNRSPANEDRPPRISDLRDSGSIEQDADFVWLLHPDENGTVAIATPKARRGPRGTDRLSFTGYCTRFEDCPREGPADSSKGHP